MGSAKKWDSPVKIFDKLFGREGKNVLPPAVKQVVWPANQGFVFKKHNEGEVCKASLTRMEVGQFVDRIGLNGGFFLTDRGETFERRAMPDIDGARDYTVFKVLVPFTVLKGTIAGAFGQEGGATQYIAMVSVADLIKQGHLAVVEKRKITQEDLRKLGRN